MFEEKVIGCMAYFTPIDIEIIKMVADGKKPGKIARKTGLRKQAVERHIEIISKIIRREVYNV